MPATKRRSIRRGRAARRSFLRWWATRSLFTTGRNSFRFTSQKTWSGTSWESLHPREHSKDTALPARKTRPLPRPVLLDRRPVLVLGVGLPLRLPPKQVHDGE